MLNACGRASSTRMREGIGARPLNPPALRWSIRSGAICGGDLDSGEAHVRLKGAAYAEGDKERHRNQPKSERHRHFAEKSLCMGLVVKNEASVDANVSLKSHGTPYQDDTRTYAEKNTHTRTHA